MSSFWALKIMWENSEGKSPDYEHLKLIKYLNDSLNMDAFLKENG